VRQSPPDSAIALALYPEDSQWGLQEHLLANIFDVLHLMLWQNTENGHAGRGRPSPMERPGMEPAGDRYVGGTGLTDEEVMARLAALNPLQHTG
jgi:hypothetical protein